jgi:hypothetical protein
MQDPKKKEVGEMGKPSLKAKFEAAMQKKFDSDNKKKVTGYESPRPSGLKEGVGEAIAGNIMSSAERLAGGAKKVMEKLSGSKKPKLLKSMSKK